MKEETFLEGEDFDKEKVIQAIEELDSSELEETDKFVMKELLRGKDTDIYFRTELNHDQIQGMIKLLGADRIFKAQSLEDIEKRKEALESVPNYISNTLMKLFVSLEIL